MPESLGSYYLSLPLFLRLPTGSLGLLAGLLALDCWLDRYEVGQGVLEGKGVQRELGPTSMASLCRLGS